MQNGLPCSSQDLLLVMFDLEQLGKLPLPIMDEHLFT